MTDLFGLSDDEAQALLDRIQATLGPDVEKLVTVMGGFVVLIDEGRNDEAAAMLNAFGATEGDNQRIPFMLGHAMAMVAAGSHRIPIRDLHTLVEDDFAYLPELTRYVGIVDAGEMNAVEAFWVELLEARDGEAMGTILGMLAALIAEGIRQAVAHSRDCADPTCPLHGGRSN